MLKTIALTVLAILAQVLYSPHSRASTSYGDSLSSYHQGGYIWFQFNWGINRGGAPDSSPVLCATARCVVTAGQWTGLGSNGRQCDQGGICSAEPLIAQGMYPWVIVDWGTTWEDAYTAFVSKYGERGFTQARATSSSNVDYVAWGKLCVGFMSLQRTGSAPGNLSPSTVCGVVSPPDLVCDMDMPLEVDLGTVGVGSVAASTVTLHVQCTGPASVVAGLIRTHSVGGSPLSVKANGKSLSTDQIVIYQGIQGDIPVTFSIDTPLNKPGVYRESVPLIISYY